MDKKYKNHLLIHAFNRDYGPCCSLVDLYMCKNSHPSEERTNVIIPDYIESIHQLSEIQKIPNCFPIVLKCFEY